MKITTWNVAGLRAMLRKDGWDWIQTFDPDVICLQEIKALPEQIVEADRVLFEPYHACWNPAEKKGYSGTLTLVKEPLFTEQSVSLSTGLGIDRFDHEGRAIQAVANHMISRAGCGTLLGKGHVRNRGNEARFHGDREPEVVIKCRIRRPERRTKGIGTTITGRIARCVVTIVNEV